MPREVFYNWGGYKSALMAQKTVEPFTFLVRPYTPLVPGRVLKVCIAGFSLNKIKSRKFRLSSTTSEHHTEPITETGWSKIIWVEGDIDI